jgi:hypothetical protein
MVCPACKAAAGDGDMIGDATLFKCPNCGGYQLSGTAITMLHNGTLQRPDAHAFAALVRRKRGNSSEYPTITSADLGG